jgi:GNAT superfamily N-acetyltransferase
VGVKEDQVEVDERAGAWDRNYWHANAIFLESSKSGAAREMDHLTLMHCGFAMPMFNSAFLKHPGEDLAAAIAEAQAYFAEIDLPFHFECRREEVATCEAALGAAGFDRAADVPVMVLDRIPSAAPALLAGLEIARVEQREDLAGFGLPERAGSAFLTDVMHARDDVEFFLGRLDGEAVATSCLVVSGATAGIYWVATREAARRKGLGEALTWAAVLAGGRRGCDYASLQASVMGRPVYTRMGFASPTAYAKFERPAAED